MIATGGFAVGEDGGDKKVKLLGYTLSHLRCQLPLVYKGSLFCERGGFCT